MITLSIVGSFEGAEESKSFPGQFFAYIQPIVAPPAGFLKLIRCNRKFGRAEQAAQRIGMFALLCNRDKLPALEIGTKVQASAICWPIAKPIWSKHQNNVVHARSITPRYVLEGDMKPTSIKAAPVTAQLKGYFQNAVRMDPNTIQAHVVIEDTPPAGLLLNVSVESTKGNHVPGVETLGPVPIFARPEQLPAIQTAASVSVTATCWPVCEPYLDEKTDSVVWCKMPDAHFVATSAFALDKARPADARVLA